MKPTESGRILVEHARRAMAELERARTEISPVGELTGTVTVGLLASTAGLLADALVTTMSQQHPGVLLRLTEGYAGDLEQWLEVGNVDLALLYNLQPSPGIVVRPILDEPLWAVAPADAGLDPQTAIGFREVAAHPLVMPSATHGLRRLVEQANRTLKTTLTIAAETNAVSIQRQLVASGHGWTVLPSIAIAQDVAKGVVSAAPLSDAMLTRRIVLAMPRHNRVPRSVRVVAEVLIEEMDLVVREGRWPSVRWLAT